MMEIDSLFGEYKTLSFYCNWVCHSKINRESDFIKDIREKIKSIDIDVGGFAYTFFGLLTFKEFRHDFNKFLKRQINPNYIPKIDYLNSFEENLKMIITDIDLELKVDGKIVTLSFNKIGELCIKGWGAKNIEIKLLN